MFIYIYNRNNICKKNVEIRGVGDAVVFSGLCNPEKSLEYGKKEDE